MNEIIVESAMGIILHAGDARVLCKEALECLASSNFEKAELKMKEANKKITEAHKIQTNSIQEETRGKPSEYSLLFAHAQDTLMTIYSELNISKQLVNIFKEYDQRLINLEKKVIETNK